MLRMKSMTLRSYSELIQIRSFEDRYKYLKLSGQVGLDTFGFDRYMNQMFYRSAEWKRMRQVVIARDNGCDLGDPDYEIRDRIAIHHMNPMTVRDFTEGSDAILNPEYLISVAHRTHNAIHYGDERSLVRPLAERRPGDTKLWLGVLL